MSIATKNHFDVGLHNMQYFEAWKRELFTENHIAVLCVSVNLVTGEAAIKTINTMSESEMKNLLRSVLSALDAKGNNSKIISLGKQ